MNELEREREALRRAFGARSQTSSLDACPPAERLYDAAAGELSPPELKAMVDHVALCADCTQSWRLAREMAGEPQRVPRKPRFVLAFAAAASLLLAVGVIVNVGLPDTDPIYRGEPEAPVLVSTAPSTLPIDAFDLSWQSEAVFPRYRVLLLDQQLNLIWEGDIEHARTVRVPAFVLTGTMPAFWQVQALRDGVRRAESALFAITMEDAGTCVAPCPDQR